MKGLVGGPLLVGGLGPGPPAPPLKSGPGWHAEVCPKMAAVDDVIRENRRCTVGRSVAVTLQQSPVKHVHLTCIAINSNSSSCSIRELPQT